MTAAEDEEEKGDILSVYTERGSVTLRVYLHMCGFVRIDCVCGKRTDENWVGVNEMREFMT